MVHELSALNEPADAEHLVPDMSPQHVRTEESKMKRRKLQTSLLFDSIVLLALTYVPEP